CRGPARRSFRMCFAPLPPAARPNAASSSAAGARFRAAFSSRRRSRRAPSIAWSSRRRSARSRACQAWSKCRSRTRSLAPAGALALSQESISICLPAGNSKVEGQRRPPTGRSMATSHTSKVIQHLRRAALLRDGAGMTDGQLLECFLTQRDDAAFAALVRRHGPMVWGVCRRVLRNYHDAEDAFQATFLVLVRKAATVEPKEMGANWLYGVAYQTALKARSVAARRKERERQVREMPEPAVEEQEVWHDLQPLLDQELSRLPDKYRVPIVLCDLEGKTRKEAAQQ